MFAAVGAQSPYFVLYYQLRGFDLATIGPILSLSAFAGLVAAPAWGSLSDRFRGAPRLILLPTLLALAGVAALWASTEVLPVAISVSMIAAGMAGLAPIVEARGLETSGSDRAGYGPLRAVGSASFIVAAGVNGLAVARWGVGAVFVSFALTVIATGLVGLSLVPASRREDVVVTARPGLREIAYLFEIRPLAIFLVGAALAWTSVAAVIAYYALRLTAVGAPATYIGAAAMAGAIVEVPIMSRFPWIAARVGSERLLVVGAVLMAARAFLAGVTDNAEMLVLIALFGGLGFSVTLVGGVTFVSRLAPKELQATAQGVFQGVTTSVGAIAAGGLAAVLAGPLGLPGLYVFVSLLGLVAAGFIAVAVRARPQPTT
jgi:PPP family 3-phenylpropionic acid transporter